MVSIWKGIGSAPPYWLSRKNLIFLKNIFLEKCEKCLFNWPEFCFIAAIQKIGNYT